MMTRLPLALAASLTLACAAPVHAETIAPADSPAIQNARQIVETIMPPDRREGMMVDIMRAIAAQMRGIVTSRYNDAGLNQILESYLAKMPDRLRPILERHLPALTDAMVQAYSREFSADELANIASFAKTPAGRHYLSRSAAILADPSVAAANRAFFLNVQLDTQPAQAELRDAIQDYLVKHPDVARKVSQDRGTPPSQP